MTELERSRLEDFKRILTYRLVTKIIHCFKGDYEAYYAAPRAWAAWRAGRASYSPKIYRDIVCFNQTALSAAQLQSIFGRGPDRKWLNYGPLIKSDPDIKTFNKGTLVVNGQRFQLRQRYQLPREYIKSVFDDPATLARARNAESDFYTRRQRRLIFTQINKRRGGAR